MPDFEKLYFDLFHGVSKTTNDLISLMQKAEETYLSTCEDDDNRRKLIKLIKKEDNGQKG